MSFQVNRNAHSQAIDTANRLDSQDSAPAPEAMPGHRPLPGKPKSAQRLSGTLSFGEKGANATSLDRDNCRYVVTFENGKISKFSHEEYVKIFGEERPPEKFDF